MSFFECCRGCVYDRYPGCAGTCERYAAAKAKHEAAKASLRYSEADTYAVDMFRKRNDADAKERARRPGSK